MPIFVALLLVSKGLSSGLNLMDKILHQIKYKKYKHTYTKIIKLNKYKNNEIKFKKKKERKQIRGLPKKSNKIKIKSSLTVCRLRHQHESCMLDSVIWTRD